MMGRCIMRMTIPVDFVGDVTALGREGSVREDSSVTDSVVSAAPSDTG